MFAHDEVYDSCQGGNPPPHPVLIPPKQRRGEEIQPWKHCPKKWRVGDTYGHLGTRLNSDVTSGTCPLVIERVKDRDGQSNQAYHLVKLEGGNGGEYKGTAPAEHTTAPVHLACHDIALAALNCLVLTKSGAKLLKQQLFNDF